MAQIAVIIENMFEDPEYALPSQAFTNAGHRLVHVGLHKGKKVIGKRNESSAIIDLQFDEAGADQFDALFIPGGYSPDKLRVHDEAVRFVKAFAASGKPIFSICHGPQLLISAGVLKGKTLTGWKSVAVDIQNAGAQYVDKEVVVDGNLVTSRKPSDIPAFIESALRVLKQGVNVQHDSSENALVNPYEESDPRFHIVNIRAALQIVISDAHISVKRVTDPKTQALLETSAEVLNGLVQACIHAEDKSEEAWR